MNFDVGNYPRHEDGAYFGTDELQVQFTVCPVQDGVSVTTNALVPSAAFAETTIVPFAPTAPSATYCDDEIEIPAMLTQLLFSWQASVTAVRADEAPSKTSDVRARIV